MWNRCSKVIPSSLLTNLLMSCPYVPSKSLKQLLALVCLAAPLPSRALRLYWPLIIAKLRGQAYLLFLPHRSLPQPFCCGLWCNKPELDLSSVWVPKSYLYETTKLSGIWKYLRKVMPEKTSAVRSSFALCPGGLWLQLLVLV